jgi:hypothetical protein
LYDADRICLRTNRKASAMAEPQDQPQSFPPGFVEQVDAFLQSQAEDGVQRLVCYDRDETVRLVINLPVADKAKAAADYAQAWRIWRDGGSILRIRPEPGGGLPQNEYRQPIGELPDFGLES